MVTGGMAWGMLTVARFTGSFRRRGSNAALVWCSSDDTSG